MWPLCGLQDVCGALWAVTSWMETVTLQPRKTTTYLVRDCITSFYVYVQAYMQWFALDILLSVHSFSCLLIKTKIWMYCKLFTHQPCPSTITPWERPGHRTGMSTLPLNNTQLCKCVFQAFFIWGQSKCWISSSCLPLVLPIELKYSISFLWSYLRPCGFLNYCCFTTHTFRWY